MTNEPVAFEKATTWNLLKSEAVIVGLATLLWYALCMAYEVGFCQYFDIPRNVISLSIWQTVDNLSAAFAVLTIIFMGIIAYKSANSFGISLDFNRRYNLAVMYMIVLIQFVIADGWSLYAIVSSCLLVPISILLFKKNGAFSSSNSRMMLTLLNQFMIAAVIMFTIMLLTPAIARHRAHFRDTYTVMTNSNPTDIGKPKEFVVLRIYDGVAYCKEIGGEGIVKRDGIVTFPIDNLRLETKRVGHLPGQRWLHG